MKSIKTAGVAFAVLLVCAGCATKKVAVQKGAEVVKTDVKVQEQTDTKVIETIKTEKIVPGDTIKKSVPASEIKKPTGVVIENEAQRITINYDTGTDSFIVQGIQKFKREVQEVKREINQTAKKQTDDKSQKSSETHNETPLPEQDKGWSGVEWGFFWVCLAAVAWLIWKFRSGIWGFVKSIF